MAETYIVGETKVRPGAYFNIQKTGNNAAASIISGVTAVIFKSDFGPLNQAVELNAEDGYADTFGTGGTTDAMQEAINGGAKTIIACRVGNGGTPAAITLNDSDGEAAVTITALYPGKRHSQLQSERSYQTAPSKSALFSLVQRSLRKSSLPLATEKRLHL